MKVKELIAKLQEYDGELEVLVQGYEGGCNCPSSIEEIKIKRDYHDETSYCGEHEELSEFEQWELENASKDSFSDIREWIDEGGKISQALIIRR